MVASVPDFSRSSVLVVGDVMLDRYLSGVAERVSPEAPVPILNVDEQMNRPGGAANVALNAASLGARVTLIGCVGNDEDGRTLEELLNERGISCHLFASDDVRTTLKLRLLSHHHHMMRLDFEGGASDNQLTAVAKAFDEQAGQHDIVVFSDYGKGGLAHVDALIAAARRAGRTALVDPKGRDFERYRGASVLAPNMQEFEAVAGVSDGEDEFVRRANGLRRQLELDALLVTRGDHGMSLFTDDEMPVSIESEAREVFDVTGAGDTVIATMAACMGAGLPAEKAAAIANRAAGIAVSRLGAATITPQELEDNGRQASRRKIVSTDQIGRLAEHARSKGETVVMTNGCFDILHAGHVAYLEEAAGLGDRLVVAVNSDASVARLKRSNRPINPLEHRMTVLAALAAVDWVVPFDGSKGAHGLQDTPADIIAHIRPDVLVKGGDYPPDDIVGADTVLANGGRVESLSLVDDVSTSEIIERILESR